MLVVLYIDHSWPLIDHSRPLMTAHWPLMTARWPLMTAYDRLLTTYDRSWLPSLVIDAFYKAKKKMCKALPRALGAWACSPGRAQILRTATAKTLQHNAKPKQCKTIQLDPAPSIYFAVCWLAIHTRTLICFDKTPGFFFFFLALAWDEEKPS